MKLIFFLTVVTIISVVYARPEPEVNKEKQNPEIVCKLPEYRGHCRALLPRWRYDPATGKCREFGFGGCDANGNNFMTEAQCMKVCTGI